MENQTNEVIPAPLEEEKTIVLRKPIKIGEVVYDHLDLREANAKELADAYKTGNEIEVAIALISRIAKVPRAAVEQLCQRDLKEASGFFDRFNAEFPSIPGDVIAELTKFYGWGPRDAWSLTWTELEWWRKQMLRMIEAVKES